MKLLDTCFLIDLIRGDSGAVNAARGIKAAATTSVNIYELFFGIYNSAKSPIQRVREAERLVERLEILQLDEAASKIAAKIMVELFKEGSPIDALDVFTASIGIKSNCTQILTRNTRHYERIPGIDVELY